MKSPEGSLHGLIEWEGNIPLYHLDASAAETAKQDAAFQTDYSCRKSHVGCRVL